MLIRATQSFCFVMLTNGLTLELVLDEGQTHGVWLFGERWLWEVIAGQA